jgi:hypothetical protein
MQVEWSMRVRLPQIRRINLDGSGAEIIARGIRQVVGMDFDPTSKQLYFSENQRDWLSEELPNDKLNRLVSPGKEDFGFPRCHRGNIPDPEFGWGRGCEGVSAPLALLGPHSAPLGVRFYTGSMFPPEYRNAVPGQEPFTAFGPRRERPRGRRAADERYELAALHSITSSACASRLSGTARPIARAVCALTTSSNLVGCATGMAAGFSPLRMRPA